MAPKCQSRILCPAPHLVPPALPRAGPWDFLFPPRASVGLGQPTFWEPRRLSVFRFPTDAQKCELICQSEDTGDVVFMNQVVHDGTRCSYRDLYSVCARGECVVGGPLWTTHRLPAPGDWRAAVPPPPSVPWEDRHHLTFSTHDTSRPQRNSGMLLERGHCPASFKERGVARFQSLTVSHSMFVAESHPGMPLSLRSLHVWGLEGGPGAANPHAAVRMWKPPFADPISDFSLSAVTRKWGP